MTSIYKISEQIIALMAKGEPEEIIQAIRECYATAAKLAWYEGKQNDLSEMDGAFIYSFKNLNPVKDEEVDMWYIDIPSTYVGLPHEMGINQVSYMKGQDSAFVRIGAAGWGIYSGLKSSTMGGLQVYQTENTKMYFPKMTDLEVGPILLKLSVALDAIDVDEEINIPGNIVDTIIGMVLQRYGAKAEDDQTLNN